MRAARRALAHPEAAGEAAARFPIERLAPVVAVYAPQGGEMDPGPLARRLAAAGARIVLPVAVARDAPLIFRAADGAAFAPDAAGILAPGPEAAVLVPGLVVAPVLALDARGGRLGQGGGYYDRTLAALRAGGRVFVVGLAFAGQEVDEVPTGPHDERLDAILTEMGYRETGKSGA